MKIIEIPILNDRHNVCVFLGKKKEIIKAGALYLQRPAAVIAKQFIGGATSFKDSQLVILIRSDNCRHIFFMCLAYEASRCLDHLVNRLQIDRAEAFRAVGIAKIINHVSHAISIDKRKIFVKEVTDGKQ